MPVCLYGCTAKSCSLPLLAPPPRVPLALPLPTHPPTHPRPPRPAPQVVSGERRLVLGRQLIGNQDQVTDLRFVGPPGEPTALAVATNSEAVRLYSLATMSCAVSLVGHRDIVLCLDGGTTLPGGPPRRGGKGGVRRRAALCAEAPLPAGWALPAGGGTLPSQVGAPPGSIHHWVSHSGGRALVPSPHAPCPAPASRCCCCCAVLVLAGSGACVLASGSKDQEVRVWDAASGACLAVGVGHVGAVSAVALARK